MTVYSVFLFDIDGVLVTPYGYRAALRATLSYFYQQMHFPERLLPDEDVLSRFEAIQITSEWDMLPICLAAVIDAWMALNSEIALSEELPQAIQQIGASATYARLPDKIDYFDLQYLLKDLIEPGVYPADAVLQRSRTRAVPDLFPRLTGHGLLERLLSGSRDIERSLTTRVFQHFTLGSAAFQDSYQQPALFQTGSLLSSLDRPQLSPELSCQVLTMRSSGLIHPAVFTMRPSLAPRGVDSSLPLKYAPEAEIALELVQLASLPLIGYGRIQYLADQFGMEPESLLKPSPVQAIAAILAAVSGAEKLALIEAYSGYAKSFNAFSLLSPQDQLRVHVFEDSAGGMDAVLRAAEWFNSRGIITRVYSYGITAHPEKIAALERIGATIYASPEQAIQQALQQPTDG